MKKFVSLSIVCMFLLLPFGNAMAGEVDLPDNTVWSCYDVGSSGYVMASAVANAILKKYDKNVRLSPSGTSIGRVKALTNEKARVAFLATEAMFGALGLYDFANYGAGPIDIRGVMGAPTSAAVAVTKTGGIKEPADLKGKRVSYVVGSASLNVKMEAYLAYGGLTWDDVEKVVFPSYGASLKALIQGNTDASLSSPRASTLYELEGTPQGVAFVPLDPENKEGWREVNKVMPTVAPYLEDTGAGLDPNNPVWLLGYTYPTITVRADEDADFVYNLLKALDETYPMYKDAAKGLEMWSIELATSVPTDLPYHEGSIRYLKEKGLWPEAKQQWNDATIQKMKRLQSEWPKAVAEGKSKGLDVEQFQDFWLKKVRSM